jgi:hypothetical protein
LYILFIKKSHQNSTFHYASAGLIIYEAAKLAGVPVRMHTLQDSYFPTKKDFTAALIAMDRLLCKAHTYLSQV